MRVVRLVMVGHHRQVGTNPVVIVKVNSVVRENHVVGMETLVGMELLVGMG